MSEKRKTERSIEKKLAGGPIDMPFLMLTLLLVGLGLVMLLSASYASAYYKGLSPAYYFWRQAAFAVAGFPAMYFLSRFDYQQWRALSIGVLVAALVLLVAVHIPGLGVRVNGALRWINLFGLQFQPSEIAKLGVILFFASRLSKRQEGIRSPYRGKGLTGYALNKLHNIGFMELLPYGIVLVVIIVLLARQPHMSAIILILIIAAALLFAAGVNVGWFVLAGTLVGGVLLLMIFTTDYMTTRMVTWVDPWSDPRGAGYQVTQSLMAIGSGGSLGLGLGNSRQKFLYLPEEHNDFIFSIVSEELGFIGAGLILVLFALLIIRGYWIALHARDRFGSLLVVGITTLLAFQTFLNVGVVTGLTPPTGISLPFFSYGGTALLIQMAEMGIILAVSRQIPAPKTE